MLGAIRRLLYKPRLSIIGAWWRAFLLGAFGRAAAPSGWLKLRPWSWLIEASAAPCLCFSAGKNRLRASRALAVSALAANFRFGQIETENRRTSSICRIPFAPSEFAGPVGSVGVHEVFFIDLAQPKPQF